MSFGTFEHKLSRIVAQLDNPGRALNTHAIEAQAFVFFDTNQNELPAWLLYHRVICLIDGDNAPTDDYVQHCRGQFGPGFTPADHLQLECDRLIGTARCAKLIGSPSMALAVAERFIGIRDELLAAANSDPAWTAQAHYAYGRTTHVAHLEDVAHLSFRLACEGWKSLGDNPDDVRVGRSLVFLLRSALELGAITPDEIDETRHRLLHTHPAYWKNYGQKLMHDKNGLGWFSQLDIRW